MSNSNKTHRQLLALSKLFEIPKLSISQPISHRLDKLASRGELGAKVLTKLRWVGLELVDVVLGELTTLRAEGLGDCVHHTVLVVFHKLAHHFLKNTKN